MVFFLSKGVAWGLLAVDYTILSWSRLFAISCRWGHAMRFWFSSESRGKMPATLSLWRLSWLPEYVSNALMELQTIVVGGASASMTWFDSAGRMTQKSMLLGETWNQLFKVDANYNNIRSLKYLFGFKAKWSLVAKWGVRHLVSSHTSDMQSVTQWNIVLVFVFWCDKTGSYTEIMAAFSCSTSALGMSRAGILQICHCRDCANVYEIFASLNVFTFERSLGSGPSTESHHSRRHSLSLWSAMLRGDVWTEWFQFACHLRRHEVLHYQAYCFFICVHWWKEDIIWPIEARNTECEQVCLRKGSEEWQGYARLHNAGGNVKH